MGALENSEPEQEAGGKKKATYSVRCHCGTVKGRFKVSKEHVVAWDCNCSDCAMRGNVHIIIPQDDFRLDMSQTTFIAATIEYLWGTKTATRRTCGILPWYRPRSNPDGYGITLKCVDWGEEEDIRPRIEIKMFDGRNWEKHFAHSGISNCSKN